MEHSELVELLWAKTWRRGWGREVPPGAEWHSLVAHAWDSAHAGGWLWDHLLAQRVQALLAADLGGSIGSARTRLAYLAAAHDLGKGTPVFQGLSVQRRAELVAAGLAVDPSVRGAFSHAWLSGRLIFELLCRQGWKPDAAEWVALTLAGHHGMFPDPGWLDARLRPKHLGIGTWEMLRVEVHAAALAAAGAEGARQEWARAVPSVAAQLVQAGAVTLADWLASNEDLFTYEGRLPRDYQKLSARRARRAGAVMGVQAAWTPDGGSAVVGAGAMYQSRFGIAEPRSVQEAVYDLACEGEGSGLLVVEAPMGVGKTEAALVAAEVLAARFGASGVFFGLPTQATANQIFRRVLKWLKKQGADTTVALAHGKAARQEDYQALLSQSLAVDACEPGLTGSHWILGRHRALLAPVVVATVDQLLMAGLASRFVSVRMLGLAGKVVVLDEVHAYDAYMSGVLHGVLAWLGVMGVPVVLLSATLSDGQRAELASAYAWETVQLPADAAYPRLTWIGTSTSDSAGVGLRVVPVTAGATVLVRLEMLPEPDVSTVANTVERLAAGGGCVLVLRNTVGRAHEAWQELRRRLGDDAVTLLHARFTVADRRRLEDGLAENFGPEGLRPSPHVVVATQVVEQSLDVSFDALVTDMCPVDLLFQRIGRMHRHPVEDRPALLVDPSVIVTGYRERPGRPPELPRGSRTVYGEHLLWRTAAVLRGRAELLLPADIPSLVNEVYGAGDVGPLEWQDELLTAAREAQVERLRMRQMASQVALKDPRSVENLADLHADGALNGDDDENSPQVQSVVRLGKPSLEVVLLRAGVEEGTATTVSDGEIHTVSLKEIPDADIVEAVLDQAVRLPAWSDELTASAREAAFTPEAWKQSAWLASARVLLLPHGAEVLSLGRFDLAYTPLEGLILS